MFFTNNSDYDLQKVGNQFCIEGTVIEAQQINGGNINRTYKVTYECENGSKKDYLFQKVNTYVFKNPVEVMENIDKVTTHIYHKRGGINALHFHHTKDRKNYYFEEGTGFFWRVRNYFDSVTFDVCNDVQILYLAGVAFGNFQKDLQDFDATVLHETIKDFHNTRKRLEQLFADADQDEYGRVAEVQAELSYIKSVREKACSLTDLLKKGELPLRVTHNDTKINNVLFDQKTREALVVIDLDTVMPGLVGHDFGDAIRFASNFVEEDSRHTEQAGVNLNIYWAFAEGFLKETASTLTDMEAETLGQSCFCLACELATRFLDDYIQGDKYFKIKMPDHNLVRTRCQIALAKDMQQKMDAMNAIVRDCWKRYQK